ncbi:MAG: DUF465 domain-containing protein [Pseudomonadota bacterium]
MTIQARIDTLTQRHQALEAALQEERSYLALDEQRIGDIKRRKLAIKDEMMSLQTGKLHS